MSNSNHAQPSAGQPDQQAQHARHDRILISAQAAGDLMGRDLDRASSLLATCQTCRTLAVEITAVTAETRALAGQTRSATRDFRLTPERAAALLRGSLWRRLSRPFNRSGGDLVRPLAGAFTTLGVAGLLLAALPFLPMAGGASTALAPESSGGRGGAYETFDPHLVPPGGPEMNAGGGGASQGPSDLDTKSTDIPGGIESLESPADGVGTGQDAAPTDRLMETWSANGMLVALSVGSLALGLALLFLRRFVGQRR